MPDCAREALRGGDAGLGDRHHHVGFDHRLTGECLAHALARRVHALAVEVGVGPGEVDELEEAELGIGFGEALAVVQARRVDDDHLAGLDLAHEVGADDVERCGLAGEHPATLDATEDQRPEPVGVAHADEVGLVHHHEREAALELRQHVGQRPLELLAVAAGLRLVLVADELGDERGVGGGVEADRAVAGREAREHAEALGELERVGEVAVVPEREAGVADRPVDRLRVAPAARSGGAVAHVTDGEVTLERGDAALVEHLGDESHVLRHGDGLAVAHRDAGRLLAPVLERIEAQIGEMGDVLAGRVHAEHAAGVADRGVVHGHVHAVILPYTGRPTPTPPTSFRTSRS